MDSTHRLTSASYKATYTGMDDQMSLTNSMSHNLTPSLGNDNPIHTGTLMDRSVCQSCGQNYGSVPPSPTNRFIYFGALDTDLSQ